MKVAVANWVIGLSALVITSVATNAHAETAKPKTTAPASSFTTRDDSNQWSVQGARKSMQWDASKGRWGLKFDMEQPAFREMAPKDVVQAGAYFKVTPSLRVGGGVALGDSRNLAKDLAPKQPAPRVRLETTFKF